MPLSRLLPRRVLVGLAVVVGSAGCAGGAAEAGDASRAIDVPTSTTGSTTSLAPLPRWGIEDLPMVDVGPVDDGNPAWGNPRIAGGRLLTARAISNAEHEVARIDPMTGAVLARMRTSSIEAFATSTGAVLVTHPDQHVLEVYDPDTLTLRHRIEMPADARVSLNIDGPRDDDFWLGARRYDDDQLAGRYTAMSAIHVDVASGQVLDVRDTPPCGASTVAKAGADRLVMGVVCAHTIDSMDLATGAVESTAGFPVGVQQIAGNGDLWMRWKPFGYVAQLPDAAEPDPLDRIRTLDLNADGPTLSDVGGFTVADDVVWVTGETADPNLPHVVFALDPDTFEVRARAWVPGPLGVVGDVGYAIKGGRLMRADLRDVTEAAPRVVVRPSRGAPPEVEPGTDDEREIIDTFSTVFDPAVPNDVALPLVDGGPDLADVRTRLVDLVHALYPDVDLRVTAIAVDRDTASLNYVFLQGGEVAFVPLTGTLERVDGSWVVTRDSICQLATSAAITTC